MLYAELRDELAFVFVLKYKINNPENIIVLIMF